MTIQASRLGLNRVHDDGVDAWRMVSVAPPAPLANLITGYCDYRETTGSFTVRRELPHAQAVLIVNLAAPISIVGGNGNQIRLHAGEAFVAGAHLQPAMSCSDGTQAGVHVFLSLASLRRLIGIPMTHLVDQVLPLSSLLGVQARSFCAAMAEVRDIESRVALLDGALLHRFAATPMLAPALVHALGMLRDRPSLDIGEIAYRVGWSRKHLANRVRDTLGVGPRSWRRLLRFEKLTRLLAGTAAPNWSAVAHDAGYFDQSHMNREFREFAHLTPGEYVLRNLPDGGGLIES